MYTKEPTAGNTLAGAILYDPSVSPLNEVNSWSDYVT